MAKEMILDAVELDGAELEAIELDAREESVILCDCVF